MQKKKSKRVTVCRLHDTMHKNPKDATTKLLELINEFSKVSGYRINTQNSFAFLNTNNERLEREIVETIPFTIKSQGINHWGINLPKEKKNTCSMKTMTLMK